MPGTTSSRAPEPRKTTARRREIVMTWILCIVLGAAMLAGAVRVLQLVQQGRALHHNIPASIDDYGFDLSNLRVARESLAPRMYKDEFLPYKYEKLYTPAEVEEYNRTEHGKLLVATDRVIGVADGLGNARAYPLRFMAWHEVCNDKLGDTPICVTYCGLTDSARVFDILTETLETTGGCGTFGHLELPQLGNSGIVCNSNPLLFDSSASGRAAPTLWRQLDGQALAGEHPGYWLAQALTSSRVCQWQDWLALYPATTVTGPDPARLQDYKTDAFGPYFQTPKLSYPVLRESSAQELAANRIELKSRCLLLERSTELPLLIPFEAIHSKAQPDEQRPGQYVLRLGTVADSLTIHYREAGKGFAPATAWCDQPCSQGLYFAWYACLEPGSYELYKP